MVRCIDTTEREEAEESFVDRLHDAHNDYNDNNSNDHSDNDSHLLLVEIRFSSNGEEVNAYLHVFPPSQRNIMVIIVSLVKIKRDRLTTCSVKVEDM